MVFDPSVTGFDAEKFQRQDWSQTVYGYAPWIDHITCPRLETKDSLLVPMLIVTTLVTLSQEDRELVYLSTATTPLFFGFPRSKDLLRHNPLEVNF